MEWPFSYPDPAAPAAPSTPDASPGPESGSHPPLWSRIVSIRNVAFAVLVAFAIVPWFMPARASHRSSYAPPRVTLRMIDSRLDRIEAELMAILRHVGGKETDPFPIPIWLLKDRSH